MTTAKLPTATGMKISKNKERLRVSGLVTPAHAGQQVTVMLFRKDGVAFYRIARKRVTLNAMSRFESAFRRPAAGRCRLIVRFDGDLDHLSSQASRTIAC
jgi:hypothetical protein